MTKHVLLNNIDHQNTRVIHHFSPEFGDNLHSALVFPNEFTELQKEYPVLLRKDDPQGSFQAIALLGFAAAENLYLNAQHPTGWDARYIPASIEKGPFLIGFQRSMGMQDEMPNAVVHIDMDHPKVNTEQGQQLFLSQGGNSPYLEHISARLETIHQGTTLAPVFYKALEQLDLRGKIAIIGIAKRLEEIFFPGDSLPLYLDKRSESLKVIQHMCNEAHRFGITHHRNKRSKGALVSELSQIKGIGPKTYEDLMSHYKSVKRIKEASLDSLTSVIGQAKAKVVFGHFH